VEEFRALDATVHFANLQTLRRTNAVRPTAELANGFDLLYSHTSVPGEILGGRVARLAGIAHVVHRHTDPHFSPRRVRRLIQRYLYRRELHSTPFIAVAPHIRVSLEQLGVDSGRISVIPNGVHVAQVRKRAARSTGPRAESVVGVLGRLDPSRGQDVFVEAARRVTEQSVRFVIGGTS
jgi:glycosyltransferase involved in cell wall biosynthesis